MTRLSYLQDHEVTIQSISEELDCLKQYLASGGKIASPDLQDLSNCLERLQNIFGACQEQASEPLPAWLQPKQVKSSSANGNNDSPVSVVA